LPNPSRPTLPPTPVASPSFASEIPVFAAQPPECSSIRSTSISLPRSGYASTGCPTTSATRIPRQTISGVIPDPVPNASLMPAVARIDRVLRRGLGREEAVLAEQLAQRHRVQERQAPRPEEHGTDRRDATDQGPEQCADPETEGYRQVVQHQEGTLLHHQEGGRRRPALR